MTEGERVLTVFELAQDLKRTVEQTTLGCWVEGEVGRLQRAPSGHVYFVLKDERRDAALDCVMYKREAFRFQKNISEGARVQFRGRASFYPPRGRLQFIADVARPSGQGALLEALESLKRKLIAEGLTAPERKRPLPHFPRVVGVVTSRSGAAFSDIVTVARRRGKVRIVLCPAVVQGEQAATSLVRALAILERLAPDVIILGRGGGSAEDLMAFNDERLVRAVAACGVPIVSAVGHEIDLSLTDLVADARAATPSQAAEMVVPDQRERWEALRRARLHLFRSMRGRLTQAQLELSRAERRLADPRFVIAESQQGLDSLRARLDAQLRKTLQRARFDHERAVRRLSSRHPKVVLSGARQRLTPLSMRLVTVMGRKLDRSGSSLREAARSLQDLSPLSVLGRGYALCSAEDGSAVRDARLLAPGQPVLVRVKKGAFVARVENVVSTVENHSGFDHERVPQREETS